MTPKVQLIKNNDYPIILIHGLTGWGSDELFGIFKYWGGFGSILKHLTDQGFRVYEAVVGPFSSNRDRAVELYYFIKGGTVDYGAAHAALYNHERFGRTFPGVFPDWNENNKIHIIGHSMGGLTARALANLIVDGCILEREFYEKHPEVGISPLFLGRKQSIHSITTLATPNNGTSLLERRDIFIPIVKRLFFALASMSGIASKSRIYDFKLDHFGLRRHQRETFISYIKRVFSSSIWKSEDIAFACLSVRGVKSSAKLLATRPDIYYFSYTGQATKKISSLNLYRPLFTLNPIFIPTAMLMTTYTDKQSTPVIDDNWASNDGLVNVISSFYPFGHPAKPYNGNPQPGEWNYYPVMMGWAHQDFIGIGIRSSNQARQLCLQIAHKLQALPK